MKTVDGVLVSGGGAVGFAVALALAQRGVPVTVLEAASEPVKEFRASTFHPPTIEMLEGLGVAQELAKEALIADKFQYRDRHEGVVAEFDLGLLKDDTPYPYRLQIEQYALVMILYRRLQEHPNAQVIFDHEVTGATIAADHILAQVNTPAGPEEFRADYIIGADGARSVVREAMGVSFDGMTYPERYLVTFTTFEFRDVMPDLALVNYVSDPEDWFVLLRSPGLWRVLFPTRAEETVFDTEPDLETLDALAQVRYRKIHDIGGPYPLVFRNIYRVHQRVAGAYRVGRAFLAGDAAHVNNPLGGMGLNGGIHDAVMLGAALARVWHKEAGEELLDHYAQERRRIAMQFIQAQTAQNEQNISQRDPEARRRRHEEMRRMAADPEQARAYLLRTSMIESIRSISPAPGG